MNRMRFSTFINDGY